MARTERPGLPLRTPSPRNRDNSVAYDSKCSAGSIEWSLASVQPMFCPENEALVQITLAGNVLATRGDTLRILGHTQAQLSQSGFIGLIHPSDIGDFRSLIDGIQKQMEVASPNQEAIELSTAAERAIRCRHRAREYHIVRARVAGFLPPSSSRAASILLQCSLYTETTVSLEVGKANRAWTRAILNAAEQCTAVLSPSGQFTWASEGLCELLARDASALVSTPFLHLLADDALSEKTRASFFEFMSAPSEVPVESLKLPCALQRFDSTPCSNAATVAIVKVSTFAFSTGTILKFLVVVNPRPQKTCTEPLMQSPQRLQQETCASTALHPHAPFGAAAASLVRALRTRAWLATGDGKLLACSALAAQHAHESLPSSSRSANDNTCTSTDSLPCSWEQVFPEGVRTELAALVAQAQHTANPVTRKIHWVDTDRGNDSIHAQVTLWCPQCVSLSPTASCSLHQWQPLALEGVGNPSRTQVDGSCSTDSPEGSRATTGTLILVEVTAENSTNTCPLTVEEKDAARTTESESIETMPTEPVYDNCWSTVRSVLDAMQDGVLLLQNEAITYANDAALEIMRAPSRATLVGEPAVRVLAGELWEQCQTVLSASISGKLCGQASIALAEGAPSAVAYTIIRVRFRGAPALQVSIKDTSSSTMVEEALRESVNRISMHANATRESLLFHENGTIVDCNEQFLATFRCDVQEVIGRQIFDFVERPSHRKHANETRRTISQHGAADSDNSSSPSSSELTGVYTGQAKRSDGTFFPAEIATHRSAVQARMVSVTTVLDISERLERLQREIGAARSQAEQHAKIEFVGFVCNQLRNPLNGAMGMVEFFLEGDDLPMEKREYALSMKTCVEDMHRVVDDVLNLSSVHENSITIESSEFNLQKVVDDVISKSREMARASSRNTRISAMLETQLPRYVLGDATHVHKVLLGLVHHALQATERGSVAVTIEIEQELPKHLVLLFGVKCSARMISDEDRAAIFSPYTDTISSYVSSGATAASSLSVIRGIIDLMGGAISVSENSVSFTLTVGYDQQGAARRKHSRLSGSDTPRGSPYDMRQSETHILVVEDNRINQKVLQKMIRTANYNVTCADNGLEGVRLLESTHFDLVLMDVRMPVMDGYTAAEHIRNELKLTVPIVALTANASDREKCLQGGMNDFLPKPLKKNDLLAIVKKWVT